MTMGHRVAVLLDGVLQQVDTPRALYDAPANVFVAGFIGSPAMNIRTVPLSDAGATFAGIELSLSREQVRAAQEGGGDGLVAVGFRPEDCDLVGEGDGGLAIIVDLVEELGSDAFVYGHLPHGSTDEKLVVRTEGRGDTRIGDRVQVRPRAGKHHAFHATTGRRL
jgi:multiple sugar transport system ATP-binding protein